MARRRTLAVAALALLAAAATSGCLGEEFFPEPFQWRDAGQASDEFASPNYSESRTLDLEDRTNRVRIVFEVTLENDEEDPLTSTIRQGPGLDLNVTLGSGTTYEYFFEASRTLRDLYPGSGDEPVEVTVTARGQGSWSLALDAYVPRYEDYRWYAFWDR